MKKSGKVIIDICDGIGEYEAVNRVLDVKSEGLFEVFNKHQADGKSGLINK